MCYACAMHVGKFSRKLFVHGMCKACAWHMHGVCMAWARHEHGICMACAWKGGEGADFFMIVHGAVTVNLDDTPRKTEYPRAESTPQLREQKGK